MLRSPLPRNRIFDEDKGVDYWYFDSQDTTLYLKQDSDTKQYFLKSSTENRERSRNLDSDSARKNITQKWTERQFLWLLPVQRNRNCGPGFYLQLRLWHQAADGFYPDG